MDYRDKFSLSLGSKVKPEPKTLKPRREFKTAGFGLGQGIWVFPQVRGTILGVPVIKVFAMLESILGSPCLGKLPSVFGPYYQGDFPRGM